MIKNKLIGAVILVAFLATSAIAENDLSDQTFSLVGVEGSYSSISSDMQRPTLDASDTKSVLGIGLKVGAESSNYRVFVTANYYHDSSGVFDYIITYGAQLDYLFSLSQSINLYFGVNGGYANMQYTLASESFQRTIADPYYGVDAGCNMQVSDLIGLELGAKKIILDAVNTQTTGTYTVKNMITVYASIIYRYHMD